MNKLDRCVRQGLAYDQENKNVFHQEGKRVLKQIATALGFRAGSYDLRSNQGGIAVAGEITLHTDGLYIQIHQSMVQNDRATVLVRGCKDRQDYAGERNQYAPSDLLYSVDRFKPYLKAIGLADRLPEQRRPTQAMAEPVLDTPRMA